MCSVPADFSICVQDTAGHPPSRHARIQGWMSCHGPEAGHLHNLPTAEFLSKDVQAGLIGNVNLAPSSKKYEFAKTIFVAKTLTSLALIWSLTIFTLVSFISILIVA